MTRRSLLCSQAGLPAGVGCGEGTGRVLARGQDKQLWDEAQKRKWKPGFQSLWGQGFLFWKLQNFFHVAESKQGGQEGMGSTLSFLESLLGPFLKLPGWGGDHCGSDLALSCFSPCQLAAPPVSPTLTLPQDLRTCCR